jgi:hypothetical protein
MSNERDGRTVKDVTGSSDIETCSTKLNDDDDDDTAKAGNLFECLCVYDIRYDEW